MIYFELFYLLNYFEGSTLNVGLNNAIYVRLRYSFYLVA
jgi:hypothetical protein